MSTTVFNPNNPYNTPGVNGTPSNYNPYGTPGVNTEFSIPSAANVNGTGSPFSGTTDTGYTSLPTAPPDLASVTDLVNKLNLQAQQNANNARIPGASGLEQQSSNNIASLLAGNIPYDVVRNLTQNAAERGISMGSPGGANSNASLLQALGLTSLGLQDKGQTDLTAALARNPAAPIFDPSTLLLTPAQKLAADLANKKLQLDWLRSLPQNTLPVRRSAGGGTMPQPTTGNNDWFANAFRTATGGVGVNPMPRNAPPTYTNPYDYVNPEWPEGTGTAGGGSLLDPYNIGQGFDPYNVTYDTGGFEAPYNPENPDFGSSINDYYDAGYDPFSGYYDSSMATDYVNPEWGD